MQGAARATSALLPVLQLHTYNYIESNTDDQSVNDCCKFLWTVAHNPPHEYSYTIVPKTNPESATMRPLFAVCTYTHALAYVSY